MCPARRAALSYSDAAAPCVAQSSEERRWRVYKHHAGIAAVL